jgi:hypothetical protein
MWYCILEHFGPLHEGWQGYVDWSGLYQIREFCSLDNILAPNLFEPSSEEDWQHVVQEDFMTHLITSRDYALKKYKAFKNASIFGVIQCDDKVECWRDARDTQVGYDLLDEGFGVSSITNCGGWPDVFPNELINEYGLISAYSDAVRIRNDLRAKHPEEPHAKCEIWSVYKIGE